MNFENEELEFVDPPSMKRLLIAFVVGVSILLSLFYFA
jgi:hypothetical protein